MFVKGTGVWMVGLRPILDVVSALVAVPLVDGPSVQLNPVRRIWKLPVLPLDKVLPNAAPVGAE